MDRQEILNRTIKRIEDYCTNGYEGCVKADDLLSSLTIDELELQGLYFDLENEFDICFGDNDHASITTVSSLVDYLEVSIRNRHKV